MCKLKNSLGFRFFAVINGLVPLILFQQVTNQVNKLAVLLHKCRFSQDCRNRLCVMSGNDNKRRLLSICRNVFKYPSPEANASTSPARGEVKNNILYKGYVVCQYASKLFETAESGVDKVVSSCEKNPSVHLRYMNFLRQRKTALDAPLHAVSSGRSMIEMLGVLAIIGVLSVGGIAGYSKAMRKFKINQTIEEVIDITTNIRTLYTNENNFANYTVIPETIYPLIVSDKYLKKGSVYHPFGGKIFLYRAWTTDADRSDNKRWSAFVIKLLNLYRQECIELATINWGMSDAGLVGLTVGVGGWNTDTAYPINCKIGQNNNGGNNNYACTPDLPLAPALASKWCNCGKENTCTVSLKYW